jgi:hypothetical protein
MGTTGFALRLAALASALVVGPATLAPGTAEAPRNFAGSAVLAGDGTTAAQRYAWRTMQWDFAWEFGESLSSGPYRGADISGGGWDDASDGTGRVVKWGGGIEFHSGERYDRTRDFGDTSLTLHGKPARLGRWELRERFRLDEAAGADYGFLVELVPEGTKPGDCPAYSLTIARAVPGDGSVRVGVDIGSTAWTKALTGFSRSEGEGRLYGVQVTGRRITWFVNGRAVASLGASAAIPKVPLTVRMSLLGKGDAEMRKTTMLVDWVRNYDLNKGKKPPTGASLTKGSSSVC